jgi:hypothetical protein
MTEDPPQQPVEQPQRLVEQLDKSAILGGSRRGLDSMGVAPPVPASQLPEAAQSQTPPTGQARRTLHPWTTTPNEWSPAVGSRLSSSSSSSHRGCSLTC